MFIQAYRWRMDEQRRDALWAAWHTAVLAGANFSKSGVPPLAQLMPQRQGARVALTLEQEAMIWRAWAQDHNLKFKRES